MTCVPRVGAVESFPCCRLSFSAGPSALFELVWSAQAVLLFSDIAANVQITKIIEKHLPSIATRTAVVDYRSVILLVLLLTARIRTSVIHYIESENRHTIKMKFSDFSCLFTAL